MEYSTAFLFMTGSVPGRPSTTSSTCELGSPPKPLAAPVNILDLVASWTWISMPTRTLNDLTTRADTVRFLRNKCGVSIRACRGFRIGQRGGLESAHGGI